MTSHLLTGDLAARLSREHQQPSAREPRLQRALESLGQFEVVGLFEQLPRTLELLALRFPWLAPSVPYDEERCSLPRLNESPPNNRCGPGGTHRALGSEPDARTRALIERHNRQDVELYRRAVHLFKTASHEQNQLRRGSTEV